jgi:hypothetical protein
MGDKVMKWKDWIIVIVNFSAHVLLAGLSMGIVGITSPILAQQPTATLQTLQGDVQVSLQDQADQPGAHGMLLSQGDAVRTHSGATASLIFSDGSVVKLDENTTIRLELFEQTPETGARMTRISLLWGHVRLLLSPGHQIKGSACKVEIVNAVVNVTFSEPELEVFYDVITDTTTALAHTVALLLTNRLTGEPALIVQGHTGVVHEQTIEDRERLIAPSQSTPGLPGTSETQSIKELLQTFERTRETYQRVRRFSPESSPSPRESQQPAPESPSTTRELSESPERSPSSSEPRLLPSEPASDAPERSRAFRLGTVTKAAIGVGVVAAATAGGVVAATAASSDNSSDDDDNPDNTPFTGTFKAEGPASNAPDWYMTFTFHLTQTGDSITGEFIQTVSYCCTATVTSLVSGEIISENQAQLAFTSEGAHCDCSDGGYGGVFADEYNEVVTLSEDLGSMMVPRYGLFGRQ